MSPRQIAHAWVMVFFAFLVSSPGRPASRRLRLPGDPPRLAAWAGSGLVAGTGITP